MRRALELAVLGRGSVEPNPMVGCVIVKGGEVVGEGWHQRFGEAHAEINALRQAGTEAAGADVYVTLEPCCHQGKTGPCSQALLDAKVARVFVGCLDPNPQVAGQGLNKLREASVEVCEHPEPDLARALIAPFAKLITTQRPWVIAKWAMTLDGKIASRTGSSRWISGEASRKRVHQVRGCMDAIVVGRNTAERDDPLLTARPVGPRTATRIVLDSEANLSLDSKLVQTVDEAPVLLATKPEAPEQKVRALEEAGVEVFSCAGKRSAERLENLLTELGQRQMTNVLVEGGSRVLGKLIDLNAVDEAMVFISPKIIGGWEAPSAVGGNGLAEMSQALRLERPRYEPIGDDILVHGRVRR